MKEGCREACSLPGALDDLEAGKRDCDVAVMLGYLEDFKFGVELLVALLLNGDFLFLVPVPLIDLAFAETEAFAQACNFLFSPVRVLVELFLKHFHLVAAFPEAETVGLGQKAQPPLFGRAGCA